MNISSPTMCEWLSSGEWCDVQLLCGGRVFSAHRAVLASVSSFLRELLLSCPTDDSITFIVLPDFDIEAMSSVLSYIYNGEVILHKQNMDLFLEIIKALQIFTDYQYFGNVFGHRDESNLNIDRYRYNTKKDSILKEKNGKGQYINIAKRPETQTDFFKNVKSDFLDRQLGFQTRNDYPKTSLSYLHLACEDRQRSTFLRDLFIETYPQNGNVNGLSSGVLAISNEAYRGQTSALLTNANGKYPRLDGKLSMASKNTTEHLTQLSQFYTRELNYEKVHAKDNAENPLLLKTSSAEFKTNFLFQNNNTLRTNFTETTMEYNSIGENESCFQKCSQQENYPSLDLTVTQSSSENVPQLILTSNDNKSIIHDTKDQNIGETNLEQNKSFTKVAILNHVLRSPWCPRQPKTYRPLRRTVKILEQSLITNKCDVASDDNNNIGLSDIKDKGEDVDLGNGASKCSVCSQVFTNSSCLSVHMKRHTSSARYTCGECGKTFSQLRNFKYHMSVHRGTREFAATCSVCGKYFNDRGYLSSHMKIHRNRKEYKCTLCPKSFNQRVAYNMHVRIHTGVKPHVCDQCGKAFSRKMLLKQHQRTHSGEKPYACPHCDRRFADRSNMSLHLRLHTGVKPFSCSMCPKSFTKKHHLKSHLNFHTGAKPYTCPRCNLAFTQSSNMRTHLKKCSAPETKASL